VRGIYSDDLAPILGLGTSTITRASHVEPDADGTWYADMSPVGGPTFRGFKTRAAALEAERVYLNNNQCKNLKH
jgi:hypothetical protein